MSPSAVSVSLSLVALGACVAPPDPTAESTQGLHDTVDRANDKIANTTLLVGGCMGTHISALYAITSRACTTHVGDLVTLRTPGTHDAVGRVEEVIGRPGTTASACWNRETCLDSSNLFGDLALVRISTPVPGVNDVDGMSGGIATMAWRYPGENVTGTVVGPTDYGNGLVILAKTDSLDSPSDTNGWFETVNDYSDPVDRGGGFWVNDRVVGTLWGGGYDVADGNWQHYASVPKFLDWILVTTQYVWRGTPVANNQVFDGSVFEQFTTSERVCQYACEHSASCEAYNYGVASKNCQLVTAVTGRHALSGRHSALHFGNSTGKSGDVVGYNRSDGWMSVVHKTDAGAIHEYYRNASQWFVGGLPTLAGEPPAGDAKLSAYRRGDGINVVLYRSTHGKLVEIALLSTGWKAAALPAQDLVGDPIGYVGGDGFSAVMYRDAFNRLHELRLGSQGWHDEALDLRDAGFPQIASDPVPFVDAEGVNDVVVRTTNNHLVRAFPFDGQPSFWDSEDITASSGAPLAAGRPYPYTRRNGTTAIVYRTQGGRLVELRRTASGAWITEDLTPPGVTIAHDPVAYVRTDGVDSIVYRGNDNHLRETTRSPLQHWDLTAIWGIPTVISDPTVYLRADVTNSVLYHLNFLHGGELSFSVGDSGWARTDLTLATGEQL